MNPDKPYNGPVSETFKANIQRAAELLKFNHIGEDFAMDEAGKALRQAGVHAQYEAELGTAWKLHLEIEELLNQLLVEDENLSFTSYESELLETLREKTREYGQIHNKIREVITELGYGEEEVDSAANAAETQDPIEAPVERLTRLYQDADYSVFIDSVEGNRTHFKPLNAINEDIKNVLLTAGFDSDKIKIFMSDTVENIRHDISQIGRQRSQAKDSRERQALSAQRKAKYQELLGAVAAFMREEKVSVVEGSNTNELLLEVDKDINQEIEAAIQEFDLYKQSGAYTEDESFLQAAKAVERLVQHDEKDAVVAANDKKRYLRILTSALTQLSAVGVAIGAPQENVQTADSSVVPTDAALVPINQTEVVPPVPEAVPDVAQEKYLDKVHVYADSKKSFKEVDQKYKNAMRAYYQDSSWRAKFRNGLDGAKKVFGINPELPPALQEMKDESRRLRTLYATSLAEALSERANRGNKDFDIKNDTSKVAFGRKFILEPNQQMLKLQESAVPPETANRVKKILQTFSKYKWHTRVGTVVFAGGLGLASGGVGALLAGASYQAWKMAASAGMGAGAGRLTQKGMQGRIDSARVGAVTAEDRVSKKFSLANLEELEAKLEQAQSLVSTRERQQKVATIAAAVAAGGLTGYGLSQIDVNEVLPQAREGLSDESVDRIVEQELAAAESVTPTTPAAPLAEAVSVVEQTAEVVPEVPGLKIETFTIPYYGESGGKLYETVIANTKIQGAFSAGELPEATRLELIKEIKLSMDGSLFAHKNMSVGMVEAEALSKIQAKFGTAPWFADAGITKIDIGSMERREYTLGAGAPALEVSEQAISGGERVNVTIGTTENSYTEAQPTTSGEAVASAERVSGTYVVQKGDTLSEITEKRFAEKLKGIPPIERGQLLDELFRNIQADPTLRDSIGMESEDVDMIKVNEKLNLDGVEAELSRLLERQQVLESFRTSGPLSVEADADVKTVPIKVVENAPLVSPVVPEPVEVTAPSGRVYTEAAAPVVEKTEVVPAPRPYALNGQYAEHPDYKAFIEKSFESRKAFEQTVERSAMNFDNSTYDVFERSTFFGGTQFESPYRFMGEKSLEGLSEFQSQSNEQIRAFLKDNGIKYETYLAWVDLVDEMKKALPNQPSTTVADLFQRYVAETLVPGANPLIKKP